MNKQIANWQGKHVWIVGASSGIGEALAKLLLSKGAVLALSARRAEPLGAILSAATAEQASAMHLILPLDTTIPEQLSAAHEQMRKEWPRLDVVVWLAGTYQAMRADALDLPVIHQTIAANLTSVYNGLSVFLPTMIKQKSGIVTLVSSVAGYSGLPKALVYGPTKAALINLAEVLYTDLKPHGISVYLVNPGFVATPLTAQNEFKMPALITSEVAALEIVKGLEKGNFEIHFPKRFTRVLKFLRILPYRLYFALTKNLP